MEEICKEMKKRKMTTPLFIGGATTSALHTAVKLAPLYEHVYYGSDASATAVLAKRCMMDRNAFEEQEHKIQGEIRALYMSRNSSSTQPEETAVKGFSYESYPKRRPEDIASIELSLEEVLPYFDWKMFYAIWGVRYGSSVPEAAELMQLKRDAEVELETGDFQIILSARFFEASCKDDNICFMDEEGKTVKLPMFRQEGGQRLSLCDFVIADESGSKSPFGMFAISVNADEKQHTEGCCCPACSNRYEDLIGRTIKQTLAEAASRWLDCELNKWYEGESLKIVKPAAGYASCPDHSLKKDILDLLGEGHRIRLTESCAMIPDASICGLIFMHPQACYPEIRNISKEQIDNYSDRRGMDKESSRRFLGHLLK